MTNDSVSTNDVDSLDEVYDPVSGKRRRSGPDKSVRYPREILLEQAIKAIAGDRDRQYSGPKESFEATAALWQVAFPERRWTAPDIALAQTLLKTSRLITGGYVQEDTWMDTAGYAACGWEVSSGGE